MARLKDPKKFVLQHSHRSPNYFVTSGKFSISNSNVTQVTGSGFTVTRLSILNVSGNYELAVSGAKEAHATFQLNVASGSSALYRNCIVMAEPFDPNRSSFTCRVVSSSAGVLTTIDLPPSATGSISFIAMVRP